MLISSDGLRRCRRLVLLALVGSLGGCLAFPSAGTRATVSSLHEQDAPAPVRSAAPAAPASPHPSAPPSENRTATQPLDDALNRAEQASIIQLSMPDLSGRAASAPVYAAAVPVADVRQQPTGPARLGEHDELQETQLIYGERVRVVAVSGPWAFIEALEQPEYTHRNAWHGYPGWVPAGSLHPAQRLRPPNAIVVEKWAVVWADPEGTMPQLHVPLGARLAVEPSHRTLLKVQLADETVGWISQGAIDWIDQLKRRNLTGRRAAVLSAAERFLGDVYFWGGRSPASDRPSRQVTGIDCSGLVSLAYRAAGVEVPRDAHEQWMRARKVTRLEPADLIFLSAPDQPQRIVHVMLYAGDGWVIEAPGTGQVVRRMRVTERLDHPVEHITPGDRIDKQTISFGSFLHDMF